MFRSCTNIEYNLLVDVIIKYQILSISFLNQYYIIFMLPLKYEIVLFHEILYNNKIKTYNHII